MKQNKKKTPKKQPNSAPTLQEITCILSGEELDRLAKEYGVEDQRDKPLTLQCFVYLMLLGCSLGNRLNYEELAKQASNWRLLNEACKDSITGHRINQQVKERGEDFARGLFQYLLGTVLGFPRRSRRKLSRHFSKILCQDGSVIRLCQKLVDLYTGTHGEAALKIQVRYEVLSGGAELVGVSDGKRSDQSYQTPQKYGRDVLWLVDLGYYAFDRFKKMEQSGQYFVSRIKTNGQPLLIEDCPENWIGMTLQEIKAEKGKNYDMQAVVGKDLFVRVIGIYNPEEENHWWYMTNVDETAFSAQEIQDLYRLRWEIELFFRGLKHVLNVLVILNQKDKSKIRSQLYYAFSYYLLIQIIRLKAAWMHRVKWERLSFACCERLLRSWLIERVTESHDNASAKWNLKVLMDKIRKEAYL